MLENYRTKTNTEIPTIKSRRGWYELRQNSQTRQYHLVRLATNGQVLWWTEGYDNKADAYISLKYPGYDGQNDLVIEMH